MQDFKKLFIFSLQYVMMHAIYMHIYVSNLYMQIYKY